MRVVKARYGISDICCLDVTDTINKLLDRNCNSFHLCSPLFGPDPSIGVIKYLAVEWEDGFKRFYKEDTLVVLEHIWGDGCKVSSPFYPVKKRNLIYHVAPLSSGRDMWKWNISLLKKLGDSKINGKRVVGIVTGNKMDCIDDVLKEFGDFRIDQLIVSKNSSLGETETFNPALRQIESTCPDECFYYAHTKGVSYQGRECEFEVREWTECMYECLFGHSDLVDDLLLRYPVVGAFKSYGERNHWGFKQEYYYHYPPYNWMFNGSFFVCRHDCLFSNRHWDRIEGDRYWIERYPAFFFENKEAGVVLDSLNLKYTNIEELNHRFYIHSDWNNKWRRSLEGLRRKC